MTNIHDAYINALLADATYALTENNSNNGQTGQSLADALSSRMTTSLANFIGDNFTVITHKETADFGGSGFDATVWEDNDGKAYVSFQGTTGVADWGTDIDLTLMGVAFDQVIDMVNWWLKNTAPLGSSAMQINGYNGIVVAAPSVFGTGLLSYVTEIAVNGHSLGGHLATAFTRLFGGVAGWDIEHTYTYNSAGFNGLSEGMFQQIEALLGAGVSKGYFEGVVGQSNFFAENGLNVTTQDLFNGQQGLRTPIFNEESIGVPNHYMDKLTDSLALADALYSLDDSFDFTK